MKNKTKLIRYYLAVAFALFGCSRNEQNIKIEYYSEGKIKSEVPIKNGKEDGLKTNYYENGHIRSLVSMKNGLKDGSLFYFTNEGRLESIGHYNKDTEQGDFVYFDKLKRMDTVVGFNKGIVKKYIVFDTVGNIINASPFITITAEHDTVKLDEIYSAHIRLNFSLKGYDCNIYVKTGGKPNDEIFTLIGAGTDAIYTDTAKTTGEHIYIISALQINHSMLDKKGKGYNADFKIKIEKKYWVK